MTLYMPRRRKHRRKRRKQLCCVCLEKKSPRHFYRILKCCTRVGTSLCLPCMAKLFYMAFDLEDQMLCVVFQCPLCRCTHRMTFGSIDDMHKLPALNSPFRAVISHLAREGLDRTLTIPTQSGDAYMSFTIHPCLRSHFTAYHGIPCQMPFCSESRIGYALVDKNWMH